MPAFDVGAGLHVEEVDGALLILHPTSSRVFELTAEQVEAFRLAESGAEVVPGHLATPMAGLVELGLVTAPGWDRRRVLLAGGIAAAAAVAAIALPSPAAAQSAPGGGGPVGPTVPAPPSIIEITAIGRGYHAVIFAYGADGGSPIQIVSVYVNGVLDRTTSSNTEIAFSSASTGDSVQITATNAVGESSLSAPVIAP